MSVIKAANVHQFVEERLKDNELMIENFSNKKKKTSVKNRMFNILTNRMIMDSVLVLFKLVICLLILPLLFYINFETRESFINFVTGDKFLLSLYKYSRKGI